MHSTIRKTIKTRGHFPNDDAALRLIWLAIMRASIAMSQWRFSSDRMIEEYVERVYKT